MLKQLCAGILLATLVTVGAIAETPSNPPVPSARPAGSDKESHAAGSGKEASNNERGSDQSPLVVEVRTTPNADKIAADEANYAKQEALNNWRLLIITSILAAAAILQWGVLLWQGVLLRSTVKAIGVELPKFILNSLDLETPYGSRLIGGIPDEPVSVVATLINEGKTSAIIRRMVVEVRIARRLPIFPRYNWRAVLPPGRLVDHKDTLKITRNGGPTVLTDAERADIKSGKRHLWCYGMIEYEDFTDAWRKMRFCQRWNVSHRWTDHSDKLGFIHDGPRRYHRNS